jgi:hypothetical protein
MSELSRLQQNRVNRQKESNVHLDLTTAHLDKGTHNSANEGYCLLEAVSIYAGESFSETPDCVPVTLQGFGTTWNDTLDEMSRQHLIKLIPRLAHVDSSSEAEVARVWRTLDWLLFSYLPMWARAAGLDDDATLLVGQAPFEMSRYDDITETLLNIAAHAFDSLERVVSDLSVRTALRTKAGTELINTGHNVAKSLVSLDGLVVMGNHFDDRKRLTELLDTIGETAQRVAELAIAVELFDQLDGDDPLASVTDHPSLLAVVDQHAAPLRFRLRPGAFDLFEKLIAVEAPT